MKNRVKYKRYYYLLSALFILSGSAFVNITASSTRYGRLTGVNWFGFETSNYVVHGIWTRDYKSVLKQVDDLGFNCLRIPWCNEMLDKTPNSIQINESGTDPYTGKAGLNTDLEGLSSIEVLDKIIDEAASLGLYIILDNHSREADGYMNETLWYTSGCSEDQWINDWLFVINRYKNKSNVIGADLNNEPHGSTGSGMKPPASWGYNMSEYGNTDWKAAAEKCGKEILKANSKVLIIVEGVEECPEGHGYWWGGNLKGVANDPITSIPSDNLVYSPHEYGSSVHPQTWFSESNFPNNMYDIWDEHFYFIEKQKIAHLLIGEFGITGAAAADASSTDYKWFTTFMEYAGKTCSWTFWCLNPNSGDTGGLLENDWVTLNKDKYNLLKPYLSSGGSENIRETVHNKLREGYSNKKVVYIPGKGFNVYIDDPENASLKIFNINGSLIHDYTNKLRSMSTGINMIDISSMELAHGMYIAKIFTGSFTSSSLITVMR